MVPKLQNINHSDHARLLAKVEGNMRATHLKLDPIDTATSGSYINMTGSVTNTITSNAD